MNDKEDIKNMDYIYKPIKWEVDLALKLGDENIEYITEFMKKSSCVITGQAGSRKTGLLC